MTNKFNQPLSAEARRSIVQNHGCDPGGPCRPCQFEATIADLEKQLKTAQSNFIWWAGHREYCSWRLGKCDCLLTEALKAAEPVDTEWYMKRMNAARAAAGFNDDNERRRVSKKFKDAGLP
jgi:hypothetical protein